MLITKEQTIEIYNLSKNQDTDKYTMFDAVQDTKHPKRAIIEEFKKNLKLENIDASKIDLAIVERIVGLRDVSLKNVLKEEGFNDSYIEGKQRESYYFVKDYYMKGHKELLDSILNINGLEESTKQIFTTWFKVGEVMNDLQIVWEDHIIKGVNKDLEERFGTQDKVINYLKENDLMDKMKPYSREEADRMYSALVKVGNRYKRMSYANVFDLEISKIDTYLGEGIRQLLEINHNERDEGKRKEIKKWVEYFQALRIAFIEKDLDSLVKKWSQVDVKWMEIDSPIQPGHFFEYYEDKYRKAVAIEWDMRIDDLSLEENQREETIQVMFEKEYQTAVGNNDNNDYQKIKAETNNNIKKVQLHIGKPLFYFGSSFNGLFSAQVIPNDEEVSSKHGKKIFAFPEKSLEIAKKRPFLKMTKEVFGKEITDLGRHNIFNDPYRNFKVYDITTVGHEYGHVAFKGEGSEVKMNNTGNFKNIEEFKATAGGIMAFFDSEEEKEYQRDVFADVIKRAVSLIAWKEEGEVEPYYCEALITLSTLFESGVLSFNKKNEKLDIDFTMPAYVNFKRVFKMRYNELAITYLDMKNADTFLLNYVQKEENGKFFTAVNQEIKDLIDWYYVYQQKMATVLDKEETIEDWV